MFAIGIAPPPTPRRHKRTLITPSKDIYKVKFTGRPSSWLLLPNSDLSFFQRQFHSVAVDSFQAAYYTSSDFSIRFPQDSVAYNMSMTLYPLSLSYDEICESMVTTYKENMKIRWAMKKLMNKWRMKHIRLMNEEDVATQEIPKKRIVFIDWKTRTAHQFEAMTILRDSINRLFHHDQLFLQALPPRNPFTNTPLTYGALISLHEQLHRVGVTHWIWEAYAASNFDIETLERSHEVPMKLRCLDVMMKDKTNYNTLDFVLDFIIGEYTHHVKYPPPSETLVLRILVTKWDNSVVQEWVSLCTRYWKNEIRGRCDDNSIIHNRSESLIKRMRSWYAV